jgi:two-component system cell cycle sensor histidine kinase/response regulator CckA
VQSHIFEPFFTTKPIGKGTGLGLSTCYGIVTRCQGTIQVVSEPSRGTTFTIHLPACPNRHLERDDLSASIQSPAAVSSETILLAEDDPIVRGFIVSILENHGYKVLAAENGRKSVEMCINYVGPIHMLITDVVMPEVNGRELAEQARLVRPNLKVLFVSGYVDRGLRNEDILNPSNAFLEKPFSEDALLRIIGRLCGAL